MFLAHISKKSIMANHKPSNRHIVTVFYDDHSSSAEDIHTS